MEKFEIELNSSIEVQEYEKKDKNFLQIAVKLPNGETVTSEEVSVYLTLSKDAMIGLGTELIRAAMLDADGGTIIQAKGDSIEKTKAYIWEFFPADASGPSQVLGVCMHPKSCLLKIYREDNGTLKEAMKKEGIEI